MIIEESGWYATDKDEIRLVARNKDELIDYLDNENCLTDIVSEYICHDYDMEDFIDCILRYDGFYMTREDMIEAFANDEIEEGRDFDSGSEWLEWLEAGYNTDAEDE